MQFCKTLEQSEVKTITRCSGGVVAAAAKPVQLAMQMIHLYNVHAQMHINGSISWYTSKIDYEILQTKPEHSLTHSLKSRDFEEEAHQPQHQQ